MCDIVLSPGFTSSEEGEVSSTSILQAYVWHEVSENMHPN